MSLAMCRITIGDIAKADRITIKEDGQGLPIATRLLARFDGSCKDPSEERPSAGAGCVIYESDDGHETFEIERAVIPLPALMNSAVAEAAGSTVSLRMIIREARKRGQTEGLVIQGDNKTVIDFWRERRT